MSKMEEQAAYKSKGQTGDNLITVLRKPLSVNDCWRGRRFKTPAYKQYEKDVLWLLPRFKLPEPPYKVYYEFGVSSPLADFDNPIKPLTDLLQKKYDFNDKSIELATIRKVLVPKGQEYVRFKIEHL